MTPTNLGRELGMDESKFAPCVTQGSYLNHLLESNSIIKIDEKISEGLFVGLHHAKEHPSFATIQNPNQIRLLLTGWGFYGDENVDDLHKVMNNPKSLEEAGNSIFINNQLCAIPISHVRNSILALVEGIFERQKHVNQLRDNLLTKCSIPFGDDLQSAFDQESLIDRISNVSPDEPSNEDLKLKIVSAECSNRLEVLTETLKAASHELARAIEYADLVRNFLTRRSKRIRSLKPSPAS